MQKHSLRGNVWTRLALSQYLDTVYRLAYARTRSRQDAEDVSQEVMLKLCRSADRIESEAHLKHWLIRVTVNECANIFRSPWKRRFLPLEEGMLSEVGDAPAPNDRLDAALEKLKPDQRTAIHLFYYEDMSTEEIARALGVKPTAVRERLHRARKKLKELLEGKEADGNV